MNPEQFKRVAELFEQARNLTVESRREFLAAQLDAGVRSEVETLLRHHGETNTPLDDRALGRVLDDLTSATRFLNEVPADESWSHNIPERIGHYKIVRKIGEGGMGIVYEARQENPARTVALKVIRPGLINPSLQRRFHREAQMLGHLQHPAIAHIYEAGSIAENQQPYFAMEYVAGCHLTDYVRTANPPLAQRLDLFATICDAVEHAHQQGIIHRDLKPGNILVVNGIGPEAGKQNSTATGTEFSPSARKSKAHDLHQPKILDFGVARLVHSDDSLTTFHTDVGQLIGTLSYMSPEQVSGDIYSIDARSDVYSLGVILYEMLSGRLPYDLHNQPIAQAARIIHEQEPSNLSSIGRVFRGDIATIVSKALEKDKSRRYSSAGELAADVRCYLSDKPITARPPSSLYQFEKFARRNKGLVGGLVGIFLVLVAGIIVSTSQYWKAEHARKEAVDANVEARRQQDIVVAVNKFLTEDLLSAVSPGKQGIDVSMREVLDAAAQRIEGRFKDEPIIEAAIRHTLGDTYVSLGEYETASKHFERAYDLRSRFLDANHGDTLDTMLALATSYKRAGRFREAEPIFQDVLQRNIRAHGEDYEATLETMNNMAALYDEQGRYAEAEALYLRALPACRRVLGEGHFGTIMIMNNLGAVSSNQGRYEDAIKWDSEVLERRKRLLGEEHPETLMSMNNLGVNYRIVGRYDEAEALLSKTVEIRRRVLGDKHNYTLWAIHCLADVNLMQGRLDEALAAYQSVIDFSADWPVTQWQRGKFLSGYGNCLVELRRFDEAGLVLLEAHRQLEKTLGSRHVHTQSAVKCIVNLYEKWPKPEQAEEWRAKLSSG